MLDVGRVDARRLATEGLQPGYLIDFQLLYCYSFEALDRPDWVQELQFLFDHADTKFVVGPGTDLELKRFLSLNGFTIRGDGSPEQISSPVVGRRRAHPRLDDTTFALGISRLSKTLARANVLAHTALEGLQIDEHVQKTVEEALARRRPGAIEANRSDALNWATVVHLQSTSGSGNMLGFYPYLLTATGHLLYGAWGLADPSDRISRRPTAAIYTLILLEQFPDPAIAVEHIDSITHQARELERGLKLTPAYLNPDDYQDERDWEPILENGLVAPAFRSKLQKLTHFITDPVVTETQRIYDNVALAQASVAREHDDLATMKESPRKLFDLIVEICAALNTGGGQGVLADLWRSALHLEITQHYGHTIYELLSPGDKHPYWTVERYQDPDDPTLTEYVLRWPSALDATNVLATFCRAFDRHDVSGVSLITGSDSGIERFEAPLPTTRHDIAAALQTATKGRSRSNDEPRLLWLRMGCVDFDLYADIVPPSLTEEPTIGVFVNELRPVHLEDLYIRTSGRYVLPAWLRRAFEAVAVHHVKGE